jgi:membrane associated rhomboid family serine protease
MNPGDEAHSPATAGPPPLPQQPAEAGAGSNCAPAGPPTAAAVLLWVAAGGAEPWFPSVHARQTGTPRDSLDDPLTELRLADLVQIVAWVRGVGQGYALTPAGRAALAGTSVRLVAPPPVVPARPVEPAAEDESSAVAPSRQYMLDLRPPVVTPALLVATVLWFFIGLVVAMRVGAPVGEYLGKGNAVVLARLGAVTGWDLLRGEWWRLATNCFVHFGLIHLAMNMFSLGVVGPLSEVFWGRGRTVILYAVSGLAGSCLAMVLSPTAEGGAPVMLAGASGAIWGVSTSLVVWLMLFGSGLPPALAGDLFRRLCLTLAVNAAVSFLPTVSWQAHFGGGAAGALTAGLLNVVRFGDRRRRLAAVVALLLVPVVCVTGLLAAMRSSPAWATLRDRVAQVEMARREVEEEAHRRAYNEQASALVSPIAPEQVGPVEKSAVLFLSRAPRGFFQTTAMRAKVTALRAAAVRAEAGMSGPPTGVDVVDRRRNQVRAYAAARTREFDLLLAMLAGGGVPDAPAWQAWGDARREAERRWDEIAKK